MQKMQQSVHDRVQVIVKIKPPSQDELYTISTNTQLKNKSPKISTPSAASIRRAMPMKTSLLKDYPLSFFALDSTNAKKVFFFQNPITKKLLDESVQSEKDIENLCQSVLQSSESFEFDRVFSINQK